MRLVAKGLVVVGALYLLAGSTPAGAVLVVSGVGCAAAGRLWREAAEFLAEERRRRAEWDREWEKARWRVPTLRP